MGVSSVSRSREIVSEARDRLDYFSDLTFSPDPHSQLAPAFYSMGMYNF